ncbi:unnamed protein product [Schistosoma turkestanicum]|nr:unnamed protein product [Schistosoma turkestanicum]
MYIKMLENNVKPDFENFVEKYINPKSSNNRFAISDELENKDSENRDYYGFYHPNGLTKKQRILENKYRKNDIRRVDKWLKMINKWEEVDSLWHRMYKNGRASEKIFWKICGERLKNKDVHLLYDIICVYIIFIVASFQVPVLIDMMLAVKWPFYI